MPIHRSIESAVVAAICAGLLACGSPEHAQAPARDADAGEVRLDADAPADAADPPDAAADSAPDAVADAAVAPPPYVPSRKTLHRLNRSEYDNTLRDLLGIDYAASADLPADDIGNGFDNMADVLSVSPLHVELFAQAARAAIARVVRVPTLPAETVELGLEQSTASVGQREGGWWLLDRDGELAWQIEVDVAGTYRFDFPVTGDQAGADPVRLELRIDGRAEASAEVRSDRGGEERIRREVRVDAAGVHRVAIAFVNDFAELESGLDRNLLVGALEITGPLDVLGEPHPGRARLLPCEPPEDARSEAQVACAREVISAFLPRAWRRPVTEVEVERLMRLGQRVIELGDGFELAVSMMFEAALASPHFLYRAELDPVVGDGGVPLLDDFALASRLSYFLWSSMPDDALFEAAHAGGLNTPDAIEAQVRRMLADPKAHALVDNFAGQWLYIRNVERATPDATRFPEVDAAMRASMRSEMERFFETFVTEDRSMLELLTADETFVDARLAAHYRLDGFDAEGLDEGAFARVQLAGVPRGGLLGQAGLLTALSYPTRTSPVRRGKFVLGQLLCQEPAAPPPGVEGLPEGAEAEGRSLREQMEVHRADPMCASCHDAMDPLGFGLENYDPVGRWRESYGIDPVDATGELPDGRTFHSPDELRVLLAEDPAFAQCIAVKLFVYAMGRGVIPGDRYPLRDIERAFVAADYRFADLAVAIATSAPFRTLAPIPDDAADDDLAPDDAPTPEPER